MASAVAPVQAASSSAPVAQAADAVQVQAAQAAQALEGVDPGGAGAGGWWLLAAVVVLGLWLLGAHNRLTGLRAAIGAAWQPLAEALEDELKAQQTLQARVAVPLSAERAALEAQLRAQGEMRGALTAARRRPVDPPSLVALALALQALQVSGQRLQALVKHDPALSEDEALKGALDALERLGPQVVFLRQGFNAAVDRYNLALDELPTRWAVPVLRLGQAGRL